MPLPPVSLDEFKSQLNLDPADTGEDEELWRNLRAATVAVERKVGAMRLRSVTEVVTVPTPYYWTNAVPDVTPYLTEWPCRSVDLVVGSVWDAYQSAYAVTYTVGRDPVPDDLMEATLIVAVQLYNRQRVLTPDPVQFRQGGETIPTRVGFGFPNAALDLLAAYTPASIG